MELNNFVVTENLSIIETMKYIDINAQGIAFVCDNLKLLATVTDGDIRRYILSGGNLNSPVSTIANYHPFYAVIDAFPDTDYESFMKSKSISALPLLGPDLCLSDIRFLNSANLPMKPQLNAPVAIMAGGKGTRLYPYTQILPKPLIPIGDKTITEHIMDHFEAYGCFQFDMVINYKKNLIKSYFTDNEQHRNVDFIVENEFLGTGGGLKLLSGRYHSSFFMSNCDILIEDDYSKILEFHKKQKNIITIVCATKNITLPYGTVELSKTGQAVAFKEKPSFSFITNTGLYVMEPEFLDMIPEHTFIHITDVIQECIDQEKPVGVYPISSHAWLDMGQISELDEMRERLLQ